MASENNTSVVAIFAIVLMVLIGGFLAYRAGVFGGGDAGRGDGDGKIIDVDINR